MADLNATADRPLPGEQPRRRQVPVSEAPQQGLTPAVVKEIRGLLGPEAKQLDGMPSSRQQIVLLQLKGRLDALRRAGAEVGGAHVAARLTADLKRAVERSKEAKERIDDEDAVARSARRVALVLTLLIAGLTIGAAYVLAQDRNLFYLEQRLHDLYAAVVPGARNKGTQYLDPDSDEFKLYT